MRTITALVAATVILLPQLTLPQSILAEIPEKDFEQTMTRYLATDSGQRAIGKTVEDYFRKRQQEMQDEEFEKQFKTLPRWMLVQVQ